MEKLTVTVITKNEERNISDCLMSVSFADEIIVIDSGSTDKTVEIARHFTDKVIYNPWPGHIEQKNFAVEKSSNNWILSIDADERVSDELRDGIMNAMKEPKSDIFGYEMSRKVFYLGRWIEHSGWYPDYRVRLFRKDAGYWGGINPHDTVILKGKTRRLSGDLYHYSYDDLAHHVRTMNFYTDISSKEYAKMGRAANLFHLVFHPVFSFVKKLFLKQGFRDGIPGFIIAVSTAYYVFLKYAKLWEIKKVKKTTERGRKEKF
jgi:glycosyltransferase involved in cell wall biosynthesis